MSETKKNNKIALYSLVAGLALVAVAAVWYFTREPVSNEMLSRVTDRLQSHDLSWVGRGRDYAQYSVTCTGEDKSYSMLYRIPASPKPVPAILLIHSNENPEAVFDLMNRAGNASDCAIAAISLSDFLTRDKRGDLNLSGGALGEGLIEGLHAADLALEFMQGHRIVDTTAIYVAGIGDACLLALPAAANHKSELKGMIVIDADALMAVRDWDGGDFASPIYWAKKANSLRALLISTGGNSAQSGVSNLANAFASAESVQASSQDVPEKYSVALSAAVRWIWKDRLRTEYKIGIPATPPPEETIKFRK